MLFAALFFAFFLHAPAEQEQSDRVEFAVVTHPGNSTNSLTRAQLVKHLKAQTRYWNRNQSVYLLLPRSDTLTKQFLLKHVYEMSGIELKRYWVKLVYRQLLPAIPKVMPSTTVALVVAKSQPGALTLVEAPTVLGRKDIKVLAIDGKLPGDEGYWPSMPRVKKIKEKEKEEGSEKGEENEIEESFWRPVLQARAPREAATQEEGSRDDLEERIALLEEQIAGELDIAGGSSGLEAGTGLVLRGFADVTLGARKVSSDDSTVDGESSEFAIGQLDLFFTSQPGERVSFLNETVFETDEDGSALLDVERLIVKYNFGDAASLQVGRMHSNVGFWNTTYHHGEWLQTTIGRPRILNFEDESGLLPVHLIGLNFETITETAPGELQTNLAVGNGRGATPDPPQIISDLDDAKAVNLAFTLNPSAVEGLLVGAGLFLDSIPSNTDPAAGPTHGALDETIWSASATYDGDYWTVLAEIFRIEHDGNGGDAESLGYYLQFEREMGAWTPYARIEGVDVDDSDTFYEDLDDLKSLVVGIRWDFSAWNAIKLQISHTRYDGGPGVADRDETQIQLQTAVAF
ncbi:MAG: hypothetical protein CMJ89_09930 [Planctomycetes bacterium]|nr:hypothetical protein [Planctomycetota bacterium]